MLEIIIACLLSILILSASQKVSVQALQLQKKIQKQKALSPCTQNTNFTLCEDGQIIIKNEL